ncbi:MAG: hypothetical protein U0271_11630 [Polyangiaceae bacterium]
MRPPLRSTPPSAPSPYRYLGRGGGERPVRVQVILALVAALVLVAVPLYLWRRPQPANIPSADAATAASGAAVLPAPSGSPVGDNGIPQLVPPPNGPKVEIAPIKTLKCQDPGPGRTPPERCDGIRFFEDSLSRAIRDSASCAPPSKSSFVVSFVLEMHFGKRRTNLFFGKSTSLSKSRRKELLRCVEKAMATADWDRIPHQHQRYTINAIATYPPIAEPEVADTPSKPSAPSKAPGGASKPGTKPKAKPAPKAPAKKKPAAHH